MTDSKKKRGNRKQEILEALAGMLESSPDNKITTAALAEKVGVSEAALYRHFPSKAKMFDALLDFTEETLFSRIPQIMDSTSSAVDQVRMILDMTLHFAEINPGICRILTGDCLVGEHERLKKRANQILLRLETQLKQILREAELKEGLRTSKPVGVCVDLLMNLINGRLISYVRSGFDKKPRENATEHWQLVSNVIFI